MIALLRLDVTSEADITAAARDLTALDALSTSVLAPVAAGSPGQGPRVHDLQP
ncbi:hypothetical protein [Streptomyces mirabilis]|uniref:hypothetical protein n=1 Tax=Streptomyces mirabilis TaxID=68239 RepID=UPI00332329B2